MWTRVTYPDLAPTFVISTISSLIMASNSSSPADLADLSTHPKYKDVFDEMTVFSDFIT